MSLLWKNAARSGWWDARWRGDMSAINRYRGKIAKAHGVPGFRAGSAMTPVMEALHGNHFGEMKPEDVGFASHPHKDEDGADVLPWKDDHPLNEEENWHHIPVTQVPIRRPIHATQDGVSADLVAHNLFHPGKVPPPRFAGSASEKDVGNPDVDPDSYTHEDRQYAHNTSEATRTPRFYKDEHGSMHVADGHHETAAAMMLGKTHIPGRVWDEKNPPEGVR